MGMVTDATRQEHATRQILVRLVCLVTLAIAGFYLQTAEQLLNLYGFGALTVFSELYVLAGALIAFGMAVVGVFAFALVVIVWLVDRRWSRRGLMAIGYSGTFAVATLIGFKVEEWLDRYAELLLAERGLPIVHAINDFVADHHSPPESLKALTPRYLAEIPSTGLFDYPSFAIEACGPNQDDCLGDYWLLYADARDDKIFVRGFGGCDRYIFAPSGQYPSTDTDTICHYGKAERGWGHEYGD